MEQGLSIVLISGVPSNSDCITNYKHLKELVERHKNADLICTGELYLLRDNAWFGRSKAWQELADVLEEIQLLSSENNIAICVGYPHKTSESITIRQSIFFPEQETFHYDKVHLGKNERDIYEAGNIIEVTRYKGVTIGIQLCIDTHIHEMTLMQKLKGAELILAPFNTPYSVEKRMVNWKKYIPTRGYEYNLCYGCTNTGGGTFVVDGHGKEVCTSSEEQDVKIIMIGSEQFNQKVDYMAYRRPEVYKY